MSEAPNFRHGHKSGSRPSPEYTSWIGMKARCNNPKHPKFPSYGGRGICVDEEWNSDFTAFLRDMGLKPTPHHSIERINNDGPYSKENCCWALPRAQANNTRSNRVLSLHGETRSLSEWARLYGLPTARVRMRLNRGLDIARSLGMTK
jgi:hypothetical protein